ncbi:SDR family oxidoreductase [Patescibacteria group bacterium]|nr:SDR family oxidoreductase [Patescibacteria group bacterium]
MDSLRDQVVVITGCAKGLGRATALALAEEGAVIAGHFHTSRKEAAELLIRLRERNPRSSMRQADLRDESATRHLFEEIFKEYGRVDVLINNVGNFIYTPFPQTELRQFADVIETNLYTTFLCSNLVLERMKAQGGGRIINFGCAGADRQIIREKTTPYYIAKTGVIMLTKITARSYAEHGIRVNAISPGVLESSVAEPLSMPSGRRADFNDILNAIRFLLDPRSEYVNGANIEVAGGWTP